MDDLSERKVRLYLWESYGGRQVGLILALKLHSKEAHEKSKSAACREKATMSSGEKRGLSTSKGGGDIC